MELWKKIHKIKTNRASKFTEPMLNLINQHLSAVTRSAYEYLLSGTIIPFDEEFSQSFTKFKKFTKIFRKGFVHMAEIFSYNGEETIILIEKAADDALYMLQTGQMPAGFTPTGQIPNGMSPDTLLEARICILCGVVGQTILAIPLNTLGGSTEKSWKPALFMFSTDLDFKTEPPSQLEAHIDVAALSDAIGRVIAKIFEIIRVISDQQQQGGKANTSLVIELSIIFFLDNFFDATISGIPVLLSVALTF